MYFIYLLSKSLKYSPVHVWIDVILSILPVFGLVVLASRNGSATTVLKDNGIRVGLMGAKAEDLKRLRSDTGESNI
jgi:hypothetical protein